MEDQLAGKEDEEKPCKPDEYALMGPQVEPAAGYWMLCSKLHIISLKELTSVTDDPSNKKDYFPPYPDRAQRRGKAFPWTFSSICRMS